MNVLKTGIFSLYLILSTVGVNAEHGLAPQPERPVRAIMLELKWQNAKDRKWFKAERGIVGVSCKDAVVHLFPYFDIMLTRKVWLDMDISCRDIT